MVNRIFHKVVVYFSLSLIYFLLPASAQFNYRFIIDTIRINEELHLHSFAYGRIENKLLIFGGRKDGIHGKDKGFEKEYENHNLIVFDLSNKQLASYTLTNLDILLQDALSSSNSNFCQVQDKLIITGGYSQNSKSQYITHPSLIEINLTQLLQLIQSNQNISTSFRQIINDTFAVAGGQLKFINNKFYLAGGHRFNGKYSLDSRLFRQQYTEGVYVFSIDSTQNELKVSIHTKIIDELNFHRRDFNLSPFVTEKNKIEPVAFSGVFMVNEARPFNNISSIQENGFTDISNFNQYLASYQCSRIGLYSPTSDVMNVLFFGGMAEYYPDEKGDLIRDPLVPFIKTISRVERNNNGTYNEYAFDQEMPLFMGTNSEFIIAKDLPMYSDEIIDQDKISSDTTLVGYILGGIINTSTRLNPWQDSMIHLTAANPYLTTIRLLKSSSSQVHNPIKNLAPNLYLSPNPSKDILYFYSNKSIESLQLWIVNSEGRIILFEKATKEQLDIKNLQSGLYHVYYILNGQWTGSLKFIKE